MADPGDLADGMLHTAFIHGRPLAYWRRGHTDGPALVMLHGLGSDHRGLLDVAHGLVARQLVVPDLPGFGQSAPLRAGHTLHQYARTLERLRQFLGLTRFALLGHSLGAGIALAYAASYPATVSHLCLVNPILGTPSLTIRLGELYCRSAAALPGPLARALLCSRPAVYLQDQATLTTSDRNLRRRILRQDYLTARMADPRAINESARSTRETPFDQLVQGLRARTLVVTGARDRLSTPASLRGLSWPPDADLEVVSDAGHLLPAEQPGQVAALANQFLAAPPADRPGGRLSLSDRG